MNDINLSAENFYRDLLNLLGFSLKNINIADSNAAAIDLGDSQQRIAIQVTSTASITKTKHTVNKFVEKGLYNEYDRLVILNIVKKSSHKENFIESDEFTFDTKEDIWDVDDIIKIINNLKIDEILLVLELLKKELSFLRSSTQPKNVQTILKLIELLSDDEHPKAGFGYNEKPFPDEKINKRFSDHSEYIKSEFANLFSEYGAVLEEIESNSEVSERKIIRAANHLRLYSDQVLTECDGNPRKAIGVMVSSFVTSLTNENVEVDTDAAHFFILKHLIKCNVFPYEVGANA